MSGGGGETKKKKMRFSKKGDRGVLLRVLRERLYGERRYWRSCRESERCFNGRLRRIFEQSTHQI